MRSGCCESGSFYRNGACRERRTWRVGGCGGLFAACSCVSVSVVGGSVIPAGWQPGAAQPAGFPTGGGGATVVGFLPDAMPPWAPLEMERVKLRRKTGFWAWAEVVKGAVQFECSEEGFYRRAGRPDLDSERGKRLKFERMKDSTEMFEV